MIVQLKSKRRLWNTNDAIIIFVLIFQLPHIPEQKHASSIIKDFQFSLLLGKLKLLFDSTICRFVFNYSKISKPFYAGRVFLLTTNNLNNRDCVNAKLSRIKFCSGNFNRTN